MTRARLCSCESAAVALAALALARPASAADEDGAAWGRRSTAHVSPDVTVPPATRADGVYGRFSGDLDIGFAAGAEADAHAARGALKLDLHYFSTAGLYVVGSDALGRQVDGDTRVLSLGVDVRPGFVPRWAKGMQQGPALVDLFVDSISLGLGAFWATPRGAAFGDQRGFEASLGFGLPLAGRAPGPWLEARGMLRWPERGAVDAHAVPGVLVLLSWHAFVVTPLAHDPAPL